MLQYFPVNMPSDTVSDQAEQVSRSWTPNFFLVRCYGISSLSFPGPKRRIQRLRTKIVPAASASNNMSMKAANRLFQRRCQSMNIVLLIKMSWTVVVKTSTTLQIPSEHTIAPRITWIWTFHIKSAACILTLCVMMRALTLTSCIMVLCILAIRIKTQWIILLHLTMFKVYNNIQLRSIIVQIIVNKTMHRNIMETLTIMVTLF